MALLSLFLAQQPGELAQRQPLHISAGGVRRRNGDGFKTRLLIHRPNLHTRADADELQNHGASLQRTGRFGRLALHAAMLHHRVSRREQQGEAL